MGQPLAVRAARLGGLVVLARLRLVVRTDQAAQHAGLAVLVHRQQHARQRHVGGIGPVPRHADAAALDVNCRQLARDRAVGVTVRVGALLQRGGPLRQRVQLRHLLRGRGQLLPAHPPIGGQHGRVAARLHRDPVPAFLAQPLGSRSSLACASASSRAGLSM
jgi:hypothetical protein